MPSPLIHSTDPIRRFQCRHIFADGHRCGSPCLRGENFCYYHHASRRPKPADPHHDPYNNPPNQTAFTLPTPEDRSSIQLSLGQIMNALASNALDPRRAGLLLYALQIASGNLPAEDREPNDTVLEVTFDPAQGALAPEDELPFDKRTRDFLEHCEEDERKRAARKANDPDYEDEEEDDDEDEYEDKVQRDLTHPFFLKAAAEPSSPEAPRQPPPPPPCSITQPARHLDRGPDLTRFSAVLYAKSTPRGGYPTFHPKLFLGNTRPSWTPVSSLRSA